MFLVFQISIKYHRTARLDDMLGVTAEVAKMGRAGVVFRQLEQALK
jgi:acyl-CoA thioesterase FadM